MAVSQGLLDLLPAEHKLELEVVDWTQELEASGDRDVSLGPRSRAKPPTRAPTRSPALGPKALTLPKWYSPTPLSCSP